MIARMPSDVTYDPLIPRCRHGRIILGCPHDDCPEQSAYLAEQNRRINVWMEGLLPPGRPIVNGRANMAQYGSTPKIDIDTLCPNGWHPDGPWHPLGITPYRNDIRGRFAAWRRKRKWGCSCPAK